MSHSVETRKKFRNAFVSIQAELLRSPAVHMQTLNGSKIRELNRTVISPTYLCVQCSRISTFEGQNEHVKSKKHVFGKNFEHVVCALLTWHLAVESRLGFLFCGICNDFVYDPELEQRRMKIRRCNGEKYQSVK